MKKHIPNAITCIRIICSAWMICLPVLSPAFRWGYLLCGLSDMADGIAARKLDVKTTFGSALDSAADLIFLTVATIKLIPVMGIPAWIWCGALVVLFIRIMNMLFRKSIFIAHSPMNKLTGLLLFLLPLSVSVLPVSYSASVVCVVAAAAAIHDMFFQSE